MSEKSTVPIFEYGGEIVIIVPPSYKFRVDSTGKIYDTAEEARAAIDRMVEQKEKVAKRKMSLAVIDGKGGKHTITGIHAGTGKKLVSPKCEDRFGAGADLYPEHPLVVRKISELAELGKKFDDLKDKIRKFALAADPYGLRIGLDTRYDEVEKDYQEKLTLAAAGENSK